MKIFILAFKVIKRINKFILKFLEQIISFILMKLNGVVFEKGFKSRGIPWVDVFLGGSFVIGNNFEMNNGKKYNNIGRQHQCSFVIGGKGQLIIGNNVRISSTSIVCHKKIRIGDNVKIGGNVVIYDTDFHTLDAKLRINVESDINNSAQQEVNIKNNVFIGAHSTILKGVEIGENSIIGACSVVTKSIPDNQIWGGNPARLIRSIEL
jgi:acetyltransferase-like isoleucine patch superfamily enzyme